jgi:two-component system, LytTR family, response regulator
MADLKAIIVDEERLARVNLRRLLEPFYEIEIAGEASSCESAMELIRENNPNLIFLDIQLKGETGFDLLELIENPIKVIFVTAYDEKSIRLFDQDNINYLLKPVNPVLLKEAIVNVKKQMKHSRKRCKDLCVSHIDQNLTTNP